MTDKPTKVEADQPRAADQPKAADQPDTERDTDDNVEFAKAAKSKTVDEGLTDTEPDLGPPGSNDNGGNDAVLTAK